MKSDIQQVWTSTAAQAEVLLRAPQGEVKLLLVRGVDVSYDDVQVLFDVDLEIDEGEIVALLGTNGAGKSTLLKAIAGRRPGRRRRDRLRRARHDARAAQRDRRARRDDGARRPGRVPVAHRRARTCGSPAGWTARTRTRCAEAHRARCSTIFPILRDRLDEPAGNLSGGQQQMLALGMAFLEQPRLLMIDELSLGLAPWSSSSSSTIVRDAHGARARRSSSSSSRSTSR